jgi:hypothetical protein
MKGFLSFRVLEGDILRRNVQINLEAYNWGAAQLHFSNED